MTRQAYPPAAGAGRIPGLVPRWSSSRPWEVGELARFGGGIYRCLRPVATGVTTQPGAFHDLAAVNGILISEYHWQPTRFYCDGKAFLNDLDVKPSKGFLVQPIPGQVINVTVLNTSPVSMNYGARTTFDGGPVSGANGLLTPGQSATFGLSSDAYVLVYPDTGGDGGWLDVSVNDYSKVLTFPTWELVVPGGPETNAWRSSTQSIANGGGTAISWDQVVQDEAGAMSGTTWTCPVGGIWRFDVRTILLAVPQDVEARLQLEHALASTELGWLFRSPLKQSFARGYGTKAAGNDVTLNGTVVAECARGSTRKVNLIHSHGSALTMHGEGGGGPGAGPSDNSPRFHATFVGPLT